MADVVWEEFASGPELADALADVVAEQLTKAVNTRGSALIAVSGGSTPPPFFRALSRKKIDWPRVTVTLVDERFVPATSERSNARLVTRHLLQNEAARADFVGLFHECDNVETAAECADSALAALPFPLDVAVLGMGTDLHTASFFPDAENIAELLDGEGSCHVLPVQALNAGEPRLTLSMPTITQARFIALHIEGAEKKTVLETALATDDRPAPVRTVIEKAETPVQIYWAPKQDTKS